MNKMAAKRRIDGKAAAAALWRPRLQMVDAGDGAVDFRAHHSDRCELATAPKLAIQKFGWHFLVTSDWDPVNEQLRRAAVHFRHAGVIGHRAAHRRAHQHCHRGLSHRTRAAVAAPAAHHLHRTARRRAQCDSWPVGHFCDGAVAARPFVSVAAKSLRFSALVSRIRFTASACWPAASLLPS